MKLIIQIPCYNEASTLPIALDAIPKEKLLKIHGINEVEILIIDDGSKDKTSRVARAWGVDHIVRFTRNQGLAKGFMAGLDACLRNGADIIVNTDADNQYCADDIEILIQPIINRKADIVIGERPILKTEHFSPIKKALQRFGSFIVRRASNSKIPDAPSGFRAYTRDAAMRLNVTGRYTYTLETIVQAGREHMAMTSVPIRTNEDLRPSRLASSMISYVNRSMITIIRTYVMYRPILFFMSLGSIFLVVGSATMIRFLYFYFTVGGAGHIQSLVISSMFIITGVNAFVVGILSDVIRAQRKILEDVQYRVRKFDYRFSKDEDDD
ncbi:MAG: glycosyltransferase family 2 protein [Clostridiales Family XIII bacterium]|nr:glycosyltransferase family 2 protein [Clostridiales Family XIII bacterium]